MSKPWNVFTVYPFNKYVQSMLMQQLRLVNKEQKTANLWKFFNYIEIK